MGLISFSRATAPVASMAFANNPSVKRYGGTEDYYQISSRVDGGDIYVHDYGLDSNQVLNFSWNAVSYDEFMLLMHFYETMKKTRYSFTFTDYDATTATARFISPIKWVYIKSDVLTVSFDILIDGDRAY